jgi:hypothetical protein
VLQVLGDKSDPLAKSFETDPATPAATNVAHRSADVLTVRPPSKPRWPTLLLALSLSVASASAITVAVISRANSGSKPHPVADGAVTSVRDVEDSRVTTVRADEVATVAIVREAGTAPRIERPTNTRGNGGSASSERDARAIVTVRTERRDAQALPAVIHSTTSITSAARAVLRIVVTPFGQVSIDDGPLSDEFRNSREFSVTAGRHRVRVTGGVDDDVFVDVRPGETRVLRFHRNE